MISLSSDSVNPKMSEATMRIKKMNLQEVDKMIHESLANSESGNGDYNFVMIFNIAVMSY